MESANKPRALVVDDNAFVLLDACQILEDAGFECLQAESGDGAWEVICEHEGQVTLLFSDVDMPGTMNGLQLAERVTRLYPTIEIILASGHVGLSANDLPGTTTFVPKPFSVGIVKEHLKRKLPAEKLPLELKDQSPL
ncbi:response regulator [Sphingomonas piscis]|uniref:Response regulator n=1 Tax=Sphingomonas piscis TaxID=2714943 RepID=A0A6G7YPJ6_9SPHN|nr:response regulator [Sphingomonas piscis]QIK78663.1 response regulator [Sphingomonas piscis]